MTPLRAYSVLTVLLFCGCNNSNVATPTLPPTTVVSDGKEYQVGYLYYRPDENESATRWVAFAKDVNGGDQLEFNYGSDQTESLHGVIRGEGDSELEAYEAMASKLQDHLRR